MPDIVLAPLPWSWGHLGRTLALYDRLSAAYSKVVLVSENMARTLRGSHYTVVTIPTYTEKKVYAHFPALIEQYARVLTRLAPKKLIIDNDPCALFAGSLLNIPTVEVLTPLSTAGKTLLDRQVPTGAYFKLFRKLRSVYPYSSIKKVLTRRNRILIPSIHELERTKFPSSEFIGPLFWNGWKQYPALAPRTSKERIFLTYGSLRIPRELLTLIEKTCRREDLELLHARHMIDNKTTMAAADIVICHGGHTTVLEALSSGKPVICLPYNDDQQIVSQEVQALNCGIVVDNPKNIPRAILRLLRNKDVQTACLRMKKKLRIQERKAIKI